MELFNKQLYMRNIITYAHRVMSINKQESQSTWYSIYGVIEQCCVIVQLSEHPYGIVQAYKYIRQNSKSIQAYLLEMQSSYFDN